MSKQSPIPTNLMPFSLPHQSVSSLSLSLSFSLINPLSICRNRFSLRAIFRNPFQVRFDFPPKFIHSDRNPCEILSIEDGYDARLCVCVSNFGVGGGFGFNRVERFVNFIWVSLWTRPHDASRDGFSRK